MAKLEKKNEAVQLRLVERLSVPAIAIRLGVAKSSVSVWVRDHPLTEEERRAKCGYKLLTSETATCRMCPTEFERTSTHKVFCSEPCRLNFHNRGRVTNSESVMSWQRRTKLRAIEYKGGKCIVCGYHRSVRGMKFHHLDPTQKDFGISSRGTRSWERVVKELDKCILVCGNCHDEIHDGIVDTVQYYTLSPTKSGSTYHAPGCTCGFCRMGDTKF